MKAVILAAGLGTRMQPLTNETPKPLLTISGIPLIERIIRAFPSEVSEVVVVIGYKGDQIKNFLGSEFLGKKIDYVFQEDPASGTMEALKLCRSYLDGERKFFVFYSDDLIDGGTLKKMMGYDLAAAVAAHTEPQKFGVVIVDENEDIKEIVEKPEHPLSNIVLANGLLLSNDIFAYEPTVENGKEKYLSYALSRMVKDHKIKAVMADQWIPIGTPEDLARANQLLS
ncbi:MAG: nucleotidyltransferase family protein [Patescibacteria group bacterium]|nr:nucleotidyltransferase family protein [Patescibacteria group bacterium]